MTEEVASEELGTSEAPRTDLAWNRTGLALVVSAGAVVKVIVDLDDARAPVVIIAVLVAAAVVWALSFLHGRAVASKTIEGRLLHDQRRLQRVALITMFFACAALVLALLPQR